jgi:hypothetical protein
MVYLTTLTLNPRATVLLANSEVEMMQKEMAVPYFKYYSEILRGWRTIKSVTITGFRIGIWTKDFLTMNYAAAFGELFWIFLGLMQNFGGGGGGEVFESLHDKRFVSCPKRPYHLWGSLSLLFNGYRVCCLGSKWPGRICEPLTLYSTEDRNEWNQAFFPLVTYGGVSLCSVLHVSLHFDVSHTVSACTRWFKYDRDWLQLVYTQSVPVIF